MKLFIQIRDGQPYEHPVSEFNMTQLFPDHNLDIVPDGFATFSRVRAPLLGVYEKFDETVGYGGCVYEPYSGGFRDVWYVVSMTETEKADKIAEYRGYPPLFTPSWVFDEVICEWKAPVDYPVDRTDPEAPLYVWRESDTTWVEVVGSHPEGDVPYYFNVNTSSWDLMPTQPEGDGYLFNPQIGEWVNV